MPELARGDAGGGPRPRPAPSAADRALRRGHRAEVGRGTRQLVLLGAGLDARARRLTLLADTRVFEVDHPRPRPPNAKQRRPCRERRQPSRMSGWTSTRELLGWSSGRASQCTSIRRRSPLHSRASRSSPLLAISSSPRTTPAHLGASALARPLFALVGEPLTTRLTAAEIAALVAGHPAPRVGVPRDPRSGGRVLRPRSIDGKCRCAGSKHAGPTQRSSSDDRRG